MNFAKKQLEKYGWTEGKGLGKNEDGISTAIKPKLKFDNCGVGHNPGEEFTNEWWNNVYQRALNNIEVWTDDDKVNVKLNQKNYEKKKVVKYGNFVNTEQLTPNGNIINKTNQVHENLNIKLPMLTDDELFAACGKRTAHKGARHGLKLSGKLSRIEKQEKLLLKKLQKVTISDEEMSIKKRMRKLSENKELNFKQYDENIIVDDYDSRSSTGSVTPKKKDKKKKKSVSFKDTVTAYTTFESVDVNTNKEKTILAVEESKIQDDLSIDKNKHLKEIQAKQEKFMKKHKRKKSKKDTATYRFLDGLDLCADNYEDTKCKKRKLCEFDEDATSSYIGKKECKKKKEKFRKEDKSVKNITNSLDQICKISTIDNK